MNIININKMTVRDISSIAIGWVAGLFNLVLVNNAASAIAIAFGTGAAAWIGQTICKEAYNYYKPKVLRFFKRKRKKP